MDKALIFPVLMLLVTASNAQNPSAPSANQMLNKELKELKTIVTQLPYNQDEKFHLSNLINDALTKLSVSEEQVSYKYISSLDELSTFASRIKTQDATLQPQLMTYLSKDIKLKFKTDADQMTGDNLFAPIQVTVETVDSTGNIVKDLNVHYSLVGYPIDYSNPFLSFQQLTSPAVDIVIPGYYTFWVTKTGSGPPLGQKICEIDPTKQNTIRIRIH